MNHSAALSPKLRVKFPKKAKCLFRPAPYKVFRGGRGSAKSWSFCRALLIIGTTRPLFILCTREVQNSIDESVHKLLSDQITAMGLDHFYQVFDTEIRGKNGTRFAFAGLKNQFRKIKSYEAIDICAVFEATFISDPAWETLLPTVRRDPPHGPFGQGSEIWIEYNPELDTDATHKRFALNPPEGAISIEMNYVDNPWFPQILRKQMEEMKAKDYDNYLTVWMGKTRKVLSGAIYAREISAALTDNPCRISPHVKYDRAKPVVVTFDLGRADTMSLWFIQQFGMDHAVIDYYGNTGFEFAHYLDVIAEKTYRVSKVILPHDASHKVVQARLSVLQQAREAFGHERVPKPIPAMPASIRIEALRTLFPRLFFAEGPTQPGIQGLQHYQFGVNDKGQRTLYPLHNWASHPADSLGHYAVSLRPDIYQQNFEEIDTNDPAATVSVPMDFVESSNTGWMR